MPGFALTIVAFSIVFLIIGAVGTHLRRTSPPDGHPPVFVEVLGWASGGLMLAWTGIIVALEQYGPRTFESIFAVVVFVLVVYGSTTAVTALFWKRVSRLTGTDSDGGSNADPSAN